MLDSLAVLFGASVDVVDAEDSPLSEFGSFLNKESPADAVSSRSLIESSVRGDGLDGEMLAMQ
jgi:hypothetical protein